MNDGAAPTAQASVGGVNVLGSTAKVAVPPEAANANDPVTAPPSEAHVAVQFVAVTK